MTAAFVLPVVAGPGAATNTTSAVPLQAYHTEDRDGQRWQALALVESGACDDCKGRAGEISRYQMLKRVWRENTSLPFSAATNPFTALNVAKQEMARRLRGRSMSDRDWFLTWHCPAHVWHPNIEERAYADRCENTLKNLLTSESMSTNITSLKPKLK